MRSFRACNRPPAHKAQRCIWVSTARTEPAVAVVDASEITLRSMPHSNWHSSCAFVRLSSGGGIGGSPGGDGGGKGQLGRSFRLTTADVTSPGLPSLSSDSDKWRDVAFTIAVR